MYAHGGINGLRQQLKSALATLSKSRPSAPSATRMERNARRGSPGTTLVSPKEIRDAAGVADSVMQKILTPLGEQLAEDLNALKRPRLSDGYSPRASPEHCRG